MSAPKGGSFVKSLACHLGPSRLARRPTPPTSPRRHSGHLAAEVGVRHCHDRRSPRCRSNTPRHGKRPAGTARSR
jgi:hypothetical protein